MNISSLHYMANILVNKVNKGGNGDRTMTYSALSAKLGDIPPIALRNPLGRLCEIAHDGGFPAISALVVNQDTKIPGEGFY